jgi:oxygen-independent coproporphyrinogen-3 oxidase
MIDFSISDKTYENELMELIRLFEQRIDGDLALCAQYENTGSEFIVRLASDKLRGFLKTYRFPFFADNPLEFKRLEKRHLKVAIYRTLGFLTGVNLPYGCLTGIRPTKYYSEIKESDENKAGIYATDGLSLAVSGNADCGLINTAPSSNGVYVNENTPSKGFVAEGISADEIFSKEFCVSDEKLRLIKRIAEVQKPLRNKNANAFDVFVFIPFCPTRCAYCSFVSLPLDKQKKLVEPYIECLLKELEQTKELVRTSKIKIRAVYVGGGTPTSIPAELLDKVLEKCDFSQFGATEFTVEAGRPDTLSAETVEVLKARGVTRVSVNPQTFNDRTLELIGRNHKAVDVLNAYKLVKGKFDVNMDLIAMLPGEGFADFKRSVDIAIRLGPENVTVHTLYLKKGSALKNAGYDNTDFATAAQMVDYACQALTNAGYNPYYMYRQKYTSGSLENVGYAKIGKECVYNVDIMEEDTSVIANGAAAISKKFTAEKNLIERSANYKEPLEYIKNFDKVLEKQRDFWK